MQKGLWGKEEGNYEHGIGETMDSYELCNTASLAHCAIVDLRCALLATMLP